MYLNPAMDIEKERLIPDRKTQMTVKPKQNSSLLKKSLFAVLCIAVVFGLSADISDAGWYFQVPRSYLWFPTGYFIYKALAYVVQCGQKRLLVFSGIPAVLLSFFHVAGSVIRKKGSVLWLLRNFHTISMGFLRFLSLTILYILIIYFVFHFCIGIRQSEKPTGSRWGFPALWIILIMAWLPWALTQYPAVMTADSTDQVEMALESEPLTDHHPVFHTLLIKASLIISQKLTSTRGGLIDLIRPGLFSSLLFSF